MWPPSVLVPHSLACLSRLLDGTAVPQAAPETALQLEKELDHAESLLRGLLARDIAIVAELRGPRERRRLTSGV